MIGRRYTHIIFDEVERMHCSNTDNPINFPPAPTANKNNEKYPGVYLSEEMLAPLLKLRRGDVSVDQFMKTLAETCLQNNIERSMQELVAMAEDMKLYD
jgi:hypothetical protein